MTKPKIVGVIGPNANLCSEVLYQFAYQLGEELAKANLMVVCGGKGGVMEAVCKGGKNVISPFSIGILPSSDKEDANPYCDIVIPTGIGIARNFIVVNTADIVIALGGGAGTLSEMAFAWQLGKNIIAYTQEGGWAEKLAGEQIDNRRATPIFEAKSIEEIMNILQSNVFS
ncbi:TIGR00725 family protein [Sediminitomix flava]|uniref:TIGR00725 family protein n=1 Tax=Sediminitomix flava TaxID=379075 RepID=A0A315ZG35_SEDFL|nr:TIGR00725 family protein [Sediminitomix flava]PWJ44109.1 hypothetical protein BC781_101459 [Sediminitomix flava]